MSKGFLSDFEIQENIKLGNTNSSGFQPDKAGIPTVYEMVSTGNKV